MLQEGKSPSSLLFQPISLSSLLPKLGLKIGGGQHTSPALSRKVSFLTFRTSPLHQHTAQRLRNHLTSCIQRFLWRKRPVGYSREFLVGVSRPDLQILTLFHTKKMPLFTPVFGPGL